MNIVAPCSVAVPCVLVHTLGSRRRPDLDDAILTSRGKEDGLLASWRVIVDSGAWKVVARGDDNST